jgi:hypothetical protein
MTDQLETLLRETFDRTAEDAPTATRLAGGARARLRRRRIAASTLAVTAVALGTVLWVAPPSSMRTPSPASSDGTLVVPSPAPSPTPEYCLSLDDCAQIDALRRPLHLPVVAPGTACPVSRSVTLPAGGGFSSDYQAIGEGPFRMTGGSTVRYDDPPEPGSGYENTGWPGAKVVWSIDPSYSGPVLLRGARIDGPGGLRFDRYLGAVDQATGNAAYPELAYAGGEGVSILRTFPSAVRLQSPGCYAIQADGTDFSTVIVFRAERVAPELTTP